MSSILNIGIAPSLKRELEITAVTKKTVSMRNSRQAEKIILKTREPSTNKEFDISDAWIESNAGDKRVAGLWFSLVDGQINKTSTLAKVLTYYEVDTLGQLIGKTINAYPDKNNFLVLSACTMP